MWWAIAFPFFVAAWLFLFVVMASFCLGRKDVGRELILRRVRRGLRSVFYLSVGYGGLIVVVAGPTWYHWAQLEVRGVAVKARVVSWSQEYDPEWGKQFSLVTYEFEAEVDGQRRPFRREGKLRSIQMMGAGQVQVLYDPADPSDSRMAIELGYEPELLMSLGSFLLLGIGSFVLARRLRNAGAASAGTLDKGPPAVGRREA